MRRNQRKLTVFTAFSTICAICFSMVFSEGISVAQGSDEFPMSSHSDHSDSAPSNSLRLNELQPDHEVENLGGGKTESGSDLKAESDSALSETEPTNGSESSDNARESARTAGEAKDENEQPAEGISETAAGSSDKTAEKTSEALSRNKSDDGTPVKNAGKEATSKNKEVLTEKSDDETPASISPLRAVPASANCGTGTGVFVLTSKGEVYEVGIRTGGGIRAVENQDAARCMIPREYLPGNRDGVFNDGFKQKTYDALGYDDTDGSMWAVAVTGEDNKKRKAQIYRFTPENYKGIAGEWKEIGSPVDTGSGFTVGGAVNPINNNYYFAALTEEEYEIWEVTKAGNQISKYGTVPIGRVRSNDSTTNNTQRQGDIAFDGAGNLFLLRAWVSAGALGDPKEVSARLATVSAADFASKQLSNMAIVRESVISGTGWTVGASDNKGLTGLGMNYSSSNLSGQPWLVSSLGTVSSIYELKDSNSGEFLVGRDFTIPENPPYTSSPCRDGRDNCHKITPEWAPPKTLGPKRGADERYYLWGREITDIANGPRPGVVDVAVYLEIDGQRVEASDQFEIALEATQGAAISETNRNSVSSVRTMGNEGGRQAQNVDEKSVFQNRNFIIRQSVATGNSKLTLSNSGSARRNDQHYYDVALTCERDGKPLAVSEMALDSAETRVSGSIYVQSVPQGEHHQITCVFKNKPVVKKTVKLTKIDATSRKPIQGVQFELFNDANKNGAIDAGETALKIGTTDGTVNTTDSNGNAQWENLEPGDYLLKEVAFPAGYHIQSSPDATTAIYPVRVSTANGTDADTDTVEVTVENHRKLGSIRWGKYASEAAPQILSASGALSGSQWTLMYEGETGTRWTRKITDCVSSTNQCAVDGDSDGIGGLFRIDNLEWGTYTLIEQVAPLGYLKTDTQYTFTVNASNLTPDPILITNPQAKAPHLPMSGGFGADFYRLAAVGIATAAVVLAIVYLRRKRGGHTNSLVH